MSHELKQLIEDAAKLLGMSGFCWVSGRYTNGQMDFNPLADKADAFDLMVKLRIDVLQKYEGAVYATNHRVGARALYKGNPEAATMLAITRAAAAIGRQVKEKQKC